MICKVDGYIWTPTPHSLLKGHGCPKCAGVKRKTHNEFINELKAINDKIIIISEYIGDKRQILCKCLIDDNEWYSTPNNLLRGEGCPICGAKSRAEIVTKSNDEFVHQLKEINDNIIPLSKYQGRSKEVDCQCSKCGHIWQSTGDKLLSGYGCPVCRESHGEKKIRNYLLNNNYYFESQKRFSDLKGWNRKGSLSYDFYVPKYRLLIEYQGQFHDGSSTIGFQTDKQLGIQIINDRIKRKYAENNGYKFLEIWYCDLDNIESILDKTLKIKKGGK